MLVKIYKAQGWSDIFPSANYAEPPFFNRPRLRTWPAVGASSLDPSASAFRYAACNVITLAACDDTSR